MDIGQLQKIINGIDYKPNSGFTINKTVNGSEGWLIQHYQSLEDCHGNETSIQKGRKWYISEHTTDSEVLQTLLKERITMGTAAEKPTEKPKLKSNFETVYLSAEIAVINDVGPWHLFQTVTNDAEAVVEHLYYYNMIKPDTLLLYLDSENSLDILEHKNRKFKGFEKGPDIDELPEPVARAIRSVMY